MPTAREVKIAEQILQQALRETEMKLSTGAGFDQLDKIANNNANVGLKPLLAFTARVIQIAREFKKS